MTLQHSFTAGVLAAFAAIVISSCPSLTRAAEGFRIREVSPVDGTRGASVETAVQAHVSERFEAASLTDDAARLWRGKERVPARVSGDLGGVVTISPEQPLAPHTEYTIELTAKLRSESGAALQPFRSRFRTGHAPSAAASELPRFRKTKLDSLRGAAAVALAPDGSLFVSTWDSELFRYAIDSETGRLRGERRLLWKKQGTRILSLTLEPRATGAPRHLWVGYDDRGGLSTDDLRFTSTLSRLTLPAGDGEAKEEIFITGLPNGDHPLSQCVFGPDGRLYLPLGAMTMLGGPSKKERVETPLSATILVAEVLAPDFPRPLNADTRPPVGYDASRPGAPLRIFATGVRQAYDLCWHSNGQLYAGVNMNDTGSKTPVRDGLAAISVNPDEPLIRIVEGRYYGQPNPAMNLFVLQGGNPTAGKDAWEIGKYPVGVQPEAQFDPSLLIFNLAKVGGQSANGCAEWRGPGPLRGRMLVCFYTSARTIHTFAFSPDGSRVVAQEALRGEDGKPFKFGAPLDLAIDDARGRIYVIDFADPRRGDSAKEGALWLVEAAGKE